MGVTKMHADEVATDAALVRRLLAEQGPLGRVTHLGVETTARSFGRCDTVPGCLEH